MGSKVGIDGNIIWLLLKGHPTTKVEMDIKEREQPLQRPPSVDLWCGGSRATSGVWANGSMRKRIVKSVTTLQASVHFLFKSIDRTFRTMCAYRGTYFCHCCCFQRIQREFLADDIALRPHIPNDTSRPSQRPTRIVPFLFLWLLLSVPSTLKSSQFLHLC